MFTVGVHLPLVGVFVCVLHGRVIEAPDSDFSQELVHIHFKGMLFSLSSIVSACFFSICLRDLRNARLVCVCVCVCQHRSSNGVPDLGFFAIRNLGLFSKDSRVICNGKS